MLFLFTICDFFLTDPLVLFLLCILLNFGLSDISTSFDLFLLCLDCIFNLSLHFFCLFTVFILFVYLFIFVYLSLQFVTIALILSDSFSLSRFLLI